MSETRDGTNGWSEELLHAYHDGELSGFARWRFERELRRSPALQAELDELASLGELLRQQDAHGPSPDLWDAIALRLPAIDATRAERAGGADPRSGRRLGGALGWWIKPIGAIAATAAVAAVVFYSGLFHETPTSTAGVVRWIDSGERSVMVLEDDPDTTIIWVLDGTTEGAWIGGKRDVV